MNRPYSDTVPGCDKKQTAEQLHHLRITTVPGVYHIDCSLIVAMGRYPLITPLPTPDNAPHYHWQQFLASDRGVRNRAKSWTQVSEILVEIRDPSRDLKSQAFYYPEIFFKLQKFPVRSAFYLVNYKKINMISDQSS